MPKAPVFGNETRSHVAHPLTQLGDAVRCTEGAVSPYDVEKHHVEWKEEPTILLVATGQAGDRVPSESVANI